VLGRNERRQQFTVDGIKEGFDSICVEAGGHQDREYLVKDPSQVYPEFLISYRNIYAKTWQAKIGQNSNTGSNSVRGALSSTRDTFPSTLHIPSTLPMTFSTLFGTGFGDVPTSTGPPAPPNNTSSVNTSIGNSQSIAERDIEFTKKVVEPELQQRRAKAEERKNQKGEKIPHFPDSGFRPYVRTTRGGVETVTQSGNAKRKSDQPITSSCPTDSIPPGGEIITIESDDDQPVKLGRPSTSGVQKPVGALFALCAGAGNSPGDISMETESATPAETMEPINLFNQISFPEDHRLKSSKCYNSSEKK